MRCLADFFFFFCQWILFFPEEIEHVFYGLRPARGLILFLGTVRGLAVYVARELGGR